MSEQSSKLQMETGLGVGEEVGSTTTGRGGAIGSCPSFSAEAKDEVMGPRESGLRAGGSKLPDVGKCQQNDSRKISHAKGVSRTTTT